MACSVSTCECGPSGHPLIGTPEYARTRAHVDAGDASALKQMTAWLTDNVPFTHLRFADGEFKSLIGGHAGQLNGNGEPMDAPLLQAGLRRALRGVNALRGKVLFGGDWCEPSYTTFMSDGGYFDSVPWCPSQVFVNGLRDSGATEFLRVLLTRNLYLVANEEVCQATHGLGAIKVPVSKHAAWQEVDRVLAMLSSVRPGDIIVLCAGLASKLIGYRLALACHSSTQIDMGCFFDPAAGLSSRTWIELDDERMKTFRREVMPLCAQLSA